MITKELLKSEIDKVQDDYLVVLYKIIKAFESPILEDSTKRFCKKDTDLNWHKFIQVTYGCLSEDSIEQGNQGEYEIREEIK